MIILGVVVFLAGLLALYAAITDQSVSGMFRDVLSGSRYPSKQAHN